MAKSNNRTEQEIQEARRRRKLERQEKRVERLNEPLLVWLHKSFRVVTIAGTVVMAGLEVRNSMMVGAENMNCLTIVTASILAGAVCGDHVSPISDTTILASAGAQCHHINHVSTQIPYVLCVAACCFLGYLAAGITANGWVGTGVGFAALIVVLVILDRKNKGTKEA